MPKVSVIVPIYKVEKYLKRCIESIINQSLEDIEIILVDDGSPDDSGNIADEYAQIDKRIIVIHKENGGIASARKAALDVAAGDYIACVDSDDWIHKDMCKVLYKEAVKNNSDIVMCNYIRVDDNGKIVGPKQKEIENLNISIDHIGIKEFFRKYFYTGIWGHNVWNRLYKTSVIRNNQINYDSEERWGEDVLFNLYFLCFTKKITIINQSLYYYFVRPGSLERTPSKIRHIQLLRLTNKHYSFVSKKRLNDHYKDEIFICILLTYLFNGLQLSYKSGMEIKEIANFYKGLRSDAYFMKVFKDIGFIKGNSIFIRASNMKFISSIKFKLISIFFTLGCYNLVAKLTIMNAGKKYNINV
ncbi:glycosyltransferase involved in cell wall biosynthesis [Bacillus niacini]|uniref:Glycosyltransferase involved in cell wall biosynthesis n=1 Tax=Neobacillus niacini TaxID=86668 RepID=A0A852T8V4_9BACI|nr:glycosyltransferase [Neobacillus niacini]NYE03864.1 glycosyltransferase involved in cell wall biosynthesis [Neobacillus niacini]